MDKNLTSEVECCAMALPIVYHPDFVSPLPPHHRFPMPKFGRVYQMLIRDGVASPDQFHIPEPATVSTLGLVHDLDYVRTFLDGSLDARAMRRIGLPWSEALTVRTRAAVGGTVLTARLALEHGVACSTAGGTHHAHRDFGSGFCIFNDLAVAAKTILHEELARRILVVDLDVHQGDGTAAICAHDDHIFTFSMHCEANFPYRKSISDLDVDLPVGMGNVEYLACLRSHLPCLLERVRPDLVLFDAGVDPHVQDRLGKLSLTDSGLYARDRYVIHLCVRAGIPIACVIGGGYDRDIDRLARRHCLLHRAADSVFSEIGP